MVIFIRTHVSPLLLILGNSDSHVYNVRVPQIDVLEDPVIRNVIILQTVLQEVRHRSAPVYKRLKDVIHEKEKHFYTFTNEHHR